MTELKQYHTWLLRQRSNYPEFHDNIEGLCPEKDSCPQCRKARRESPEYQSWLMKKWSIDRAISNSAVYSHMAGGADSESLPRIYTAWLKSLKESYARIKKVFEDNP